MEYFDDIYIRLFSTVKRVFIQMFEYTLIITHRWVRSVEHSTACCTQDKWNSFFVAQGEVLAEYEVELWKYYTHHKRNEMEEKKRAKQIPVQAKVVGME